MMPLDGPKDWSDLLTALDVRLKSLGADWSHPRITQWCDRVLASLGLPRVFVGKEQHYNLPYQALEGLFNHLARLDKLEAETHVS